MAAEDQSPIGSGFGHQSTAKDVLKGLDLSGRNIVVTGGYSGIGVETVRALAAAGARVTVPARDRAKAETALSPLPGDIEIAEMDLADLGSVRAFAENYAASGRPLHVLINNAGIMACPETRVGPGWEAQFATNHLGHFELARGLAAALRQAEGARVVALSSTAHVISDVHWDDPHFETHDYDKWQAYGQSKTANALFAVALDRREQDKGVRAFAVHPGGILTPLQRHLPKEEMVALGWIDESGELSEQAAQLFKTPEQGAATATWAATSPALEGKGGLYCEDCDVAPLATDASARYQHVRAHAVDAEAAAKLWTMSDAMIAAA